MSEPSNRLALVTGTSSGIGAAVAGALLQRGWRVVGLSRRGAAIDDGRYAHLRLDLQDLTALMAAVEAAAGALVSDPGVSRLALVNNAAHIGLLGPVDRMEPLDLIDVYRVNVAAPLGLMGWLLRRGRPGAALRIVNVSSGAAVQPFPGLGAYGSAKAALRMLGMVLAAELDSQAGTVPRDATILSFEPGVVDTPMQQTARGTPVEVLPIREFFAQLATEGRLLDPAGPAGAVAEYLERDGHPRFSEQRFGPPSR